MSQNEDLTYAINESNENQDRSCGCGCGYKTPFCTPTAAECQSPDFACFLQMQNILKQLIDACPTTTATVTLIDGTKLTGKRLNSLYPQPNGGMLLLANTSNVVTDAVPINQIASVATTCEAQPLCYLPAPKRIECSCSYAAANAISNYIPVGTENVTVKSNNANLAVGTVTANEWGMINVTAANSTNNYISLCGISSITRA